jgi:pimeloyl-ACP methyl ester carboxylesterase
MPDKTSKVRYDEFALFRENAEEYSIPYKPPSVVRRSVDLGDGRQLSALVWGTSEPEYVFLHGGAQNAHTWDTVLLALDRPAVAIDLPGHGHSDGGRSGYLDAGDNADDVAAVIRALAPRAKVVIGMSLGGITAIALASRHRQLVRRVVLVDITPGVNREKSSQITAFVNGPDSFPDFDAILARTVEFNPTRSEASLRRGILHNALQRDDGTWVWRYARHRADTPTDGPAEPQDPHDQFNRLWDALGSITVPVMLVRGMRPQSVVDDADEEEFRRRLPAARVEHVDAGHSVQGDRPVELAELIASFSQD